MKFPGSKEIFVDNKCTDDEVKFVAHFAANTEFESCVTTSQYLDKAQVQKIVICLNYQAISQILFYSYSQFLVCKYSLFVLCPVRSYVLHTLCMFLCRSQYLF